MSLLTRGKLSALPSSRVKKRSTARSSPAGSVASVSHEPSSTRACGEATGAAGPGAVRIVAATSADRGRDRNGTTSSATSTKLETRSQRVSST